MSGETSETAMDGAVDGSGPVSGGRAEIAAWIDEHWEEIVSDITTLVRINSVEDLAHATPEAPFGPGPAQALEAALKIVERLGFDATNLDNYIGYAQVDGPAGGTNGEPPAQVALIAHLDTVAAEGAWDVDPFDVTRKDGYLLGRGVLDDKGPAVLALWALKFLASHTTRLNHRFRVILGTNEETAKGDVTHYLKHEALPTCAFSPDAEWPVICGEKGAYNARLTWRMPAGSDAIINALWGGVAKNVIPDTAFAHLNLPVEAAARGLLDSNIELSEHPAGGTLVTAHGVAGHASTPEVACNAFLVLFEFLATLPITNESEAALVNFETELLRVSDGSSVGVAADDDVFDPLTLVSCTFGTDGADDLGPLTPRVMWQTIDCRYPKSTNPQLIEAGLGAAARAHGLELETTHWSKPHFVDPHAPLVRALQQAYHDVSGKDDAPITIGGGTYAKKFGHAVAFGPAWDERAPYAEARRPQWVGAIHGANEGVAEAQLKQALAIYCEALVKLNALSAVELAE